MACKVERGREGYFLLLGGATELMTRLVRLQEKSVMDWETVEMKATFSSVSANKAASAHHQGHSAWNHKGIALESPKHSLDQP